MKKFVELDTVESSKLAVEVWRNAGRQKNALKFLYRALCLDENNSEAILLLDELIEEFGTAAVSVGMNAYAIEKASDAAVKARLEWSRLHRLYRLGLLTHVSGGVPPADSWDDSSQFIVKSDEIAALLDKAPQGAKSLKSAFDAALNTIGYCAGALQHKSASEPIPGEEFYFRDRFAETRDYIEFLELKEFQARFRDPDI